MKKNKAWKEIGIWVTIAVSCVIYSLGISMFLNPNGLAPGGVSGIAIIIYQLTAAPTGLMILLINLPLLVAGCFAIGKWFLVKTVYAIGISSFLIDLWPRILPSYIPLTQDKFLAAVAGALLCAVGMGAIFRSGGSTGGTDIVAKLLRKRFRAIKTGTIFLIVDSIIVICSVFATGKVEDALYAGIALFITGYCLDKILYGTDEAKLLIIISSKPEELATLLMKEIDAGVTFADGSGAYTGEQKRIIICAVKKHSFHRAKDLICREDPRAFLIVSNASEIFGEGYKLHGTEEL